jgi:hypothetical protein
VRQLQLIAHGEPSDVRNLPFGCGSGLRDSILPLVSAIPSTHAGDELVGPNPEFGGLRRAICFRIGGAFLERHFRSSFFLQLLEDERNLNSRPAESENRWRQS